MVYRLILPSWAAEQFPERRRVLEGEFTVDQLIAFNEEFYNVYYLPNYPGQYDPSITVDGSHIDMFEYVFADMDLKEGKYASKADFIDTVLASPLAPTRIVDSGNGIHVYWRVTDMDAMSFLKLQRRVLRHFNTDEAVCKIYQLMRVPGTVNTKYEDGFKLCETLDETDASYTCEQLDRLLPPLSKADEDYCKQHFEKTYKLNTENVKIDDKLPLKFSQLLAGNSEVKDIWLGKVEDRSKADYRLGHVMFASGFSKQEALSVLVNTAKALSRSPSHRVNYAMNILDKIWTYEMAEDKTALTLSSSVRSILEKSGDAIKGTRFPCYRWVDDTKHGLRLGQVMGLIAGVGVGKTAMALNMFMGFVEYNPDYDHFFVPLEQPKEEIADRWRTMCGGREFLYDKVQILSNYADDGTYRNLSLQEIRDYILKYQEVTGRKVGAVVIDHIGVLKKKTKDGENQGIMDICHEMKAFAIQTNTMMIMQSQAPREKAGIGDLELNKDAAYGTVFFESYCDYLITVWQPLKRCYKEEGCPTVTAYKFCKIRHKKQGSDTIQEDVPYRLFYDPETQLMRELTQIEEKAFDFFNAQATNIRGKDRRTDLVTYTTIRWTDGELPHGKENSNHSDSRGARGA